MIFPQSRLHTISDTNESEVVVFGEVVYLGEIEPFMSSAVHIHRQTVVFRVLEVLKGKMDVDYVKVAVQVTDDVPLSTEKYKDGNKFILYLKNKQCKSSCVDLSSDWEFNVKPEFQKFEQFPCYFEESNSVVKTDDKKTEKLRKSYKENKEILKD